MGTFEQASNLIESSTGRHLIIGLPGPEIDSQTENLIRAVMPGGICLFSRNIREAAQTRELLDGIRQILPFEPILCLDQEGGLVDRLRRIMTPMPEPGKLRHVGDASLLAKIIARVVRILGFNMTLAPVVDVITNTRQTFSNGLTGRNFGRTQFETVEFAGTFLDTLHTYGCMGCLKHFPGLGAATVDSHEYLPLVELEESEFSSIDLFPYRKLLSEKNVNAVMVAHAAYPRLSLQEKDQNGRLLPASLSRSVVSGLLRDELAFNGLVISDDLEMGAILKNYGVGQAAVMSIRAGTDMVAICAEPDNIRRGFEELADALSSGIIPSEESAASLERIYAFHDLLSPPPPFDASEIKDLSSQVDSLRTYLN